MNIQIKVYIYVYLAALTQLAQCAYFVGYQAFMGKTWNKEEAKDWTIVGSQCSNKYSITNCGDTQILGGYNCLASGAAISRNFLIPHHWSIYIKVDFWLIDSWDNEDLIMKLGSLTIKETRQHSSNDYPICGASSNWWGGNKEAYYDRVYNKELKNDPHYERNVVAYFSSNLDGSPDDESFGINNFQLLIDPCNPTCDKCINGPESYRCLNCWANASFYQYSDDYQLCDCSTNEFYLKPKGQQCPSSTKSCPVKFSKQGFCKCNDGYYTVSKDVPCTDAICTECIKCDASCNLCSGPGPAACITCASGLYKQQYLAGDVSPSHPSFGKTLCQANCLSNSYYKDNAKSSCTKCNSLCKTCVGSLSIECSSCPPGLYLDGTEISPGFYAGSCVSSCSQGYSKNNTDMRCVKCNTSCIYCKDDQPNYCTECKSKLYLKDGTCYSNCPDGFWNDTPNKMCRGCDTKCNTCLGKGSFCTSCVGNYYLYQNDCLNNLCPNSFYKYKNVSTNKNTCEKCNSNCLTCNNGTSNDCLSCDPAIGFLRGTQCTVCASNQYGNSQNQVCYPCNPLCATCEGPSDKQCRSCSGSLLFSQKQCISLCPDSTYPDNTNNMCQPCHQTCLTCLSAGSNSCKSCSSGRYLRNQVCETSCSPIAEYPDDNLHICGSCDTLCLRCKDGTNKGCLECNGTKYLQDNQCVDNCPSDLFGMESTRQCLQKCPEGYYGDTTSKLCVMCNPLCPICSAAGLNNCSKCGNPLFLDGTQCKEICQLGYYGDKLDHTCKKCNENCLECSGGTDHNCTKCISTKYFGESSCYNKCPGTQYGDTVTMTCVVECPQGTYGNSIENLCKPCHNNCSNCYGPSYSQCQKCNIGYFMLNSTCDRCPKGYYSEDITRSCQQCFENCISCTGGSPSDCLECSNGYFYLREKKMCTSTCPFPFFSEDNNTDCVLKCTSKNQYPNAITRRCDVCHPACLECTTQFQDSCSLCAPNYYFLPSQQLCTQTCPLGYYENILTWMCELCDKSCASCNGSLPDQCNTCNESRILYQNRCEIECPENLLRDEERRMCVTECTSVKPNRFANFITKKCQSCHRSCSLCTGPTNKECQRCTLPFLKQGNECLETCPVGYYARYQDKENTSNNNNNNHTPQSDDCIQCHQNCQDCYGPSEKQCRICANGLFLHFLQAPNSQTENICLQICPDNYVENKDKMICEECPPFQYFNNGACSQCHYSCLKCNGPNSDNCTQCSSTRSVEGEGDPKYGQCNCKLGFMESYDKQCIESTSLVQTATRSITVSAITAGSISIITGLLSTSTFSIYQVIEISQFTSNIRYTNLQFPLNINAVLDSISTSQPNEAVQKSDSPHASDQSENKRILLSKEELEYLNERGEAPMLWQKYIITLIMNVFSWICVMIINLLVIHMKIKYDNERIMEKIRVVIQYSFPIQIFIRTAQEGFQFIFLSYLFSSSLDFFGWLNCIYMSLTALAVITIIIRGSLLPVQKKQKKNPEDEDEYVYSLKTKKGIVEHPHQLRTLWILFKDNRLSRNYYSIMLFVKMFYTAVFIFVFAFSSNSTTQMIAMAISKFLFLLYVLIVQPYKQKWHNYISIFNESLQTIIPITVLILSLQTEDSYVTLGWLLMAEIIILFLVNLVYAAIELIFTLKNIIQKRINMNKKTKQVNNDKLFNKGLSPDTQYSIFKKRSYKMTNATPTIYKEDVGNNSNTVQEIHLNGMNQSSPLKVVQTLNISTLNQTSLQILGEQSRRDGEGQGIKQDTDLQLDANRQNQSQLQDEDYNLNKSINNQQSSILNDNLDQDENLNASGFPLSVFGKYFEENQQSQAARRKKKNKKNKESVQFSPECDGQYDGKADDSIKEEKGRQQTNDISKEQQTKDVECKMQKMNDKIDKNNSINQGTISETDDGLDLIQILEQQNLDFQENPSQQDQVNQMSNYKECSPGIQQHYQNEKSSSTFSKFSQLKGQQNKLSSVRQDTSQNDKQSKDMHIVQFNQTMKSAFNPLKEQSQSISEVKETKDKYKQTNKVSQSVAKIHKNKLNIIDFVEGQQNKNKEIQKIDQNQKIQNTKVNSLFQDKYQFKIPRIIQNESNQKSQNIDINQKISENISKSSIQQSNQDEKESKQTSILEFIRTQTNKPKVNMINN